MARDTIDAELRIDGFNDISKLDDVYKWLDGTLVNASIPNIPYALVGPVVLQREKLITRQRKFRFLGERIILQKLKSWSFL